MIIALVNEAFNKNIRKAKEQFLWCTASTPRPSLLGQLYLSVSRHPCLMLPSSCCVESSSLLTSASLSQEQCRQEPGLRGEPLFPKLFLLSCSVFMCNSLNSWSAKERQLSSFSEYSCHPLLSVTCALLPECGRTSLSLRGERDCSMTVPFHFPLLQLYCSPTPRACQRLSSPFRSSSGSSGTHSSCPWFGRSTWSDERSVWYCSWNSKLMVQILLPWILSVSWFLSGRDKRVFSDGRQCMGYINFLLLRYSVVAMRAIHYSSPKIFNVEMTWRDY